MKYQTIDIDPSIHMEDVEPVKHGKEKVCIVSVSVVDQNCLLNLGKTVRNVSTRLPPDLYLLYRKKAKLLDFLCMHLERTLWNVNSVELFEYIGVTLVLLSECSLYALQLYQPHVTNI